MKNFNEELFLRPMKNYSPPSLPTLEHARKNPALLKNLPRRWKKKAGALACVGFFAFAAFAGCDSAAKEQIEYRARIVAAQESLENVRAQLESAELNLSIHHGGGQSSPWYVAHFTEAEALAFIRASLETEGFNFNAEPPGILTEAGSWLEGAFEFFDKEKNVAIAMKNWLGYDFSVIGHFTYRIQEIRDALPWQARNISIGLFYNPAERVYGRSWAVDDDEYLQQNSNTIDERKEEARQILIENLEAQVQNFIENGDTSTRPDLLMIIDDLIFEIFGG